ncbi:hypothetical protein [Legionella waltersii]|uniref:Transmembrane protein n=1 Tax=Legionella waltersii TaxID=66969 RepID=A0A0W1A4X4_9GAMM|nr:hypothetical protein [Legionella waltersii]KTD76389.1 hypothetical protein Lwal_2111 [Legionella waltersii]SNV14129.1 Uncharacterised protein [Legionella waltersii]
MTFKEIMKKVFSAPADAFEFINRALFGYSQTGINKVSGNKETVNKPGLITLILGLTNWLLTGISNFVSNHKQAIATAFWASLAVAGAAALTVALWPAALAAVTGFTVFGVSIAAVVGTGFVAQVAATAGVAAALTSAAVYVGDAIVTGVKAIIGCFCKPKESKGGKGKDTRVEQQDDEYETNERSTNTGSPRKLSALGSQSELDTRYSKPFSYTPPTQTAPLFQQAQPKTGSKQPVVTEEQIHSLTSSN